MFERSDNSWFVYYVSSASTVVHLHITQRSWAGVCNMVHATHIIVFTLYLTLHVNGLKMTIYMGESESIHIVLFLNKIIWVCTVASLCHLNVVCTVHHVLYHNLWTNTCVHHCVYQITYQLLLCCPSAFIATIIREPSVSQSNCEFTVRQGSLMMVTMNAETCQSSNGYAIWYTQWSTQVLVNKLWHHFSLFPVHLVHRPTISSIPKTTTCTKSLSGYFLTHPHNWLERVIYYS
jgi:hypothetical protein